MTIELITTEAILFSGGSCPALTEQIALGLNLPLGEMKSRHFPDREISIEIEEDVYGKKVIVVQSIARQPNEYLMELLLIVDGLKRAAAKEIIAVIPYLGYCRQDRIDKCSVPITAKLVAGLIEAAGVNQLITVDLHAPQVQGFFDIPVHHLHGWPLLAQAVIDDGWEIGIVVGPDIGSIKIADAFAERLGVEMAIIDKHRISAEEVIASELIGNVNGKNVLLADDMCSTGATLASAAKACREKGAHKIIAAVTHPLLVGSALQLLEHSPIDVLYVMDTIALQDDVRACKKVRCISCADLICQSLSR
jgi:ribose-phosphate pyrophosphokinase